MHNAVFSLLMALVTTCATALASSSLPSKAADDEQPGIVQPSDANDLREGEAGPDRPFEAG